MAILSQFGKCLQCIWPAVIAFIGFLSFRGVDKKTYYAALTPGVDPWSPQGQEEFETRKERDREKRRIIFICVGIIAAGYMVQYLYNTFTVKVKAASDPAPAVQTASTMAPVPDNSATPPDPTQSQPSETPTPARSATYAPTATDRIMVITQIVTVEIKVPVIVTPVPNLSTSTP